MPAVRGTAVTALVLGLLAGGVEARGGTRAEVTQPVALRVIEMTDAAHGYALSGNGITNSNRLLATSDGGHIWRDAGHGGSRIRASSAVTLLRRLRFFSTTLGVHRFAVERSDDGGITWRRSLPFQDSHGSPAIAQPFAVDARHLYVAVNEGAAAGSSGEALFTSSDGGRRWHVISRASFNANDPHLLPFGCDKNGFGFASPTRGWAGAYCAGGPPFLFRTDDGGHTWRRQTIAAPKQCACETSAPRFFTPRDGVLSINGFTANGGGKPFTRVYWTKDGGEHWHGNGPAVGRANRVVFSDSRTAWVTGQSPGNLSAPFDRLFRTTNAGLSWQTTKLPFDAANHLLDAVSGTIAFATSADYRSQAILVTRDGGRSWRYVTTTIAVR